MFRTTPKLRLLCRTAASRPVALFCRESDVEQAWPTLFTGAAVCSLFAVLRRLRAGLNGTALEAAWRWAALVWLTWIIVMGTTIESFPLHPWADVLWYFSAVLALTPPIAVLGARRPTSRVWTWFVLVPLVLVFTWPLLPSLRHEHGAASFSVEEPVIVGYVLVLFMGAGNYLGLRHSLAALLWMAGLLLVVLPLCPATAGWAPGTHAGRLWGTLCLVASAWTADRMSTRRPGGHPGAAPQLDRVWCDFRDLFGIVWARRIQERFNDDARQSGLPLRLGIQGLEDAAGKMSAASFDPQTRAAAEKTLRWLLQKFVDPGWIDRRLEP